MHSFNILFFKEIKTMVAANTQGVGPGSVDGNNKGSERMTLGVQHLIGPRVVAAGMVTNGDGGTVTITFPQSLNQSEAYYAVTVTGASADNSGYVSTKTDDGDGKFASFIITGTADEDYVWSVILMGDAIPQPPLHG